MRVTQLKYNINRACLTLQQVTPDQVVHSPTPVKLLTDLHDKHVLVVGQEFRVDIVKEYPFKHCTCMFFGIQVCHIPR